MEKGCVANHIHVGMIRAVFAKTLQGIFVGLRLSHVESNLMFKVFPVVGNRIVHMYRIPDNVSQKADRVFMERNGIMNDHTALFLLIFPMICGHNITGRTVDNLPPPFFVVSGIDHHQFLGYTFHKGNL